MFLFFVGYIIRTGIYLRVHTKKKRKSYFSTKTFVKTDELNILINFGRWHHEGYFCEIILNLDQSNGVARTLKKLCTSKGDYWIKQCFSSTAPLFKVGTSLKGKFAPRGSKFFPLRAVPY